MKCFTATSCNIMQVGEMEYSVVEFTDADGGGLALVNCKWFTPRKKEVFWPPYKNPSLFNKALKNGESPEISWKSYSIKRNYYQSSNYDAARKKLKLAEDTSDLQSDNSEQPIKKARIKRPPKRLYLNSSDESNLEEDCNENRPPRFEPIVVSTCNLDNTLEDRAPQSCSSVLNPLNGTATHLNENVLNSPATSNSSTVTYHSELFTPNSQSSINRNLQPFSDSRLLDKLFTDVEILKQQNKQIISLLESKAPKLLLSLPGDIPVPLPLGSEEDLKKFEDYLTEKSHLDSLLSFYSQVGGHDPIHKTNTILKKVISNQLACSYSFLGSRNNKKAFGQLLICKLIIGAVQNSTNQTDRQISDYIKVWLKHAPQRAKADILKRK